MSEPKSDQLSQHVSKHMPFFDLRAHVRSQKYMPKDVSKHISDLTAEQVSKHAKKMSEHIPEHFPAIPELMQEQMSGVHMSGSVSVCCDSLSIPLPCLLPNRPLGWRLIGETLPRSCMDTLSECQCNRARRSHFLPSAHVLYVSDTPS